MVDLSALRRGRAAIRHWVRAQRAGRRLHL
ncbi:MAG: hypothetical protein IPF57_16245 [Gammaproteobacteria bacterium]|nr:hypothetical protein [Gammaproteobacteria bacterium]